MYNADISRIFNQRYKFNIRSGWIEWQATLLRFLIINTMVDVVVNAVYFLHDSRAVRQRGLLYLA